MKKVCGTCNYQVDARANKGSIEIRCAHDNKWRKDNSPDCRKWIEIIHGLSPKDKISLVDSERKTSSDIESNRLAAEANVFAREANRLATEANIIARSQARWTRYAMITAAIAVIIATIAAIADIKWFISWVVNSISKIFS